MPVGTVIYTTGVGSIMARRWAPPLIQVTSWGWLLCGVLAGA